jgi:hypothetical protein
MTEIRNSILAGLAFGLLIGIYFAIKFNTNYALKAGLIAGILFGILLYFFVTSKTVNRQTSLQPTEAETIIYSGGANHFAGIEAVGGKLYLLKGKLQFQSHSFNIQNHQLEIDLNQIKEIRFCNTLGLIPNGMLVTLTDGKTERFVVGNRRLWKKKIEEVKSSH